MSQQRANVRGAYDAGGRGRRGNNTGRGRGRGQRGGFSSSVRGGRVVGGGAPSDAPLIYKADQPARVDARVDSADELIPRLRALGLTKEHPPRPGYGTIGRAIVVRANYFAMDLTRDTYYDYVVDISPVSHSRKPTAHVKSRVLTLFERSPKALPYIHKIAHDGAQRLVAAERLPQPLQGVVKYFDDEDSKPRQDADSYTVSVQFIGELPTAPLKRFQDGDVKNIDKAKEIDPLISALNLIMQRQAAQHGALMGFYSSVRPVHKQLMVNVNVCMAAFYEPGKLSDALHAFRSRSRGAIPQDFLAKVKVSTNYRGYKCVRAIFRISDVSAKKQKFSSKEYGRKVTVEEYFSKTYGIKLKEADTLPLIDIGNSGKPVYVPAELCTIERGEPFFGRLGRNETTSMLRYASRKPAMNAQLIVERGLPRLGYTPTTPVLDAFGVHVSGEMSVIPARELPPPKVTYATGSPRVEGGSWNLRDVKFHRGSKAPNWMVLVVRDGVKDLSFDGTNDPRLLTFLNAFANKCRNSGMDLALKPSSILETDDLSIIEDQRRRPAAVARISRAIERTTSFTPGIKRLCAVDFGVHSQCLWLKKALDERGREQYLANVALKLNTKLGGINHLLGKEAMSWLREKPTMLVGIDVTHPSPKSASGTPSIVGVVASIDNDFVQFPASLRLQKSKREVIRENVLRDMIVERLQAYRQRLKVLPERMIVFRDGVSESQYTEVLEQELSQIFQAFARVDPKNPKYHPVLSIVVCGKRHHARFFPTDSKYADRNGNTRPGTVVDKGITSVLDFDFYLQAHAGLQGSVKSTHYVVLYDESSLTANDVQQGVHTASYLYARATKAVSLVPPAYYADIVCERARYWIHEFLLANTQDDDDASSGTSTCKGVDSGTSASAGRRKLTREEAENHVFAAAERAWGNGLHVNLRDSMFYL
ncbi:Piwi-domain-containing protein [Lactarius akahatsu]|uniref:Piwi-domain-containing protein n=1 Tax=Lactarius akahatsu TaxID=416441 RepID=A0AAD4LGB3_9AGAM|nr:Piwi-domain-containing protein [Lactarius akahatsu]